MTFFGADTTCREAIESMGHKPVAYSREDSYKTIKGKKEKGPRTETMFKFYIQPELESSINEIIAKIESVLQDTNELTDRFSVRVFKDKKK